MFSFALYILSFAANTLVVLTAPTKLLKEYVLFYNIASVVYSITLFFYFSKLATVRRSLAVAITAVALIGGAIPIIGSYKVALIAYPGLLILTDYLATQSHSLRVVTLFRIAMIASAAPFLLLPDQFAINLEIRVFALGVLAVTLAATAKVSHLLAVKSPIRFQIGNYVFYNGTLSLVALLIHIPEALRWWYLCIQIGLVLVLKVLDYSLRRAYSLDSRTRLLAMLSAGCVPFAAFVAYPNFLALGLFYIGFFGLAMTGRYIAK
jgi:hypothetical protein